MSWKAATPMSLRLEFWALATRPEANVAALCRRFEISRKTGYKWLARYRDAGAAGLGCPQPPSRERSSPVLICMVGSLVSR